MKIGRYRDVCIFFTKAASRYPELFKASRLELLNPYSRMRILDSSKGEPVNYYVHAEIQLITFYDLTPSLKALAPRVFGVSKWACYLCNLFVSLHGKYFISKTHGRLYHQWTVPNLASMSTAQRRQYRKILQEIHQLCKAAALKSSKIGRSYPPESAYDFHAHGIPSPIAASSASPISSQNTIRASSIGPHVQDLVSNRSAAMELTAAIPSAGRVPVPDAPGSSSDPPSEVRYECADEGKERGVCVSPPQHAESQTASTSASLAANADPADCLLKHTITHQEPYHLDLHGVHICFEAGENTLGRITLRENSTVPNGTINVDAMAAGDVLDFYRKDESLSVHLDLHRTAQRSISLDLEWLPD
ncbi:MAG: hypothetical protein Q9193_003889 [Seirophora villosa]